MGGSYVLVVMGIVLAKAIGFLRDIIFAGTFGTSVEADIYVQVFGLVNLMFTGIGVSLSTLIIKRLNNPLNRGKERAYAASFLRKSIVILAVAVLSIMALAAPITKIILPDLSGADFLLAKKLIYVMAPSLMFVVIAYIISGILQNERKFFITSIMSLPFNALIILTLFKAGADVLLVSLVTTIGWFLHIAILLPDFYKKGYSFLRKKELITKEKEGKELLYIFISGEMFQLLMYTDRAFVVGKEGMASTFNYASNLFITISSVFIVAMSTVIFPAISKNYEEGKLDYVKELLLTVMLMMAAIFVPYLLVVGVFGEDIIRLIYERNEFSASDTYAVAKMFFLYSLGILGYLAQDLFNKVIYLAGKYKYTVFGTIGVIVLNLLVNFAISFVPSGVGFGVKEILIAVSSALLLTAYAFLVFYALFQSLGKYITKDFILDLLKVVISGAFALIVYLVFNVFAPEFTHGKITFIVPLMVSGAVYVVSAFKLGLIKRLLEKVRKDTDDEETLN